VRGSVAKAISCPGTGSNGDDVLYLRIDWCTPKHGNNRYASKQEIELEKHCLLYSKDFFLMKDSPINSSDSSKI
jgi:hypothetical protein